MSISILIKYDAKFSNVCSLYNKQEKKLKFDKSSIVLHVIYSATKLYAKG